LVHLESERGGIFPPDPVTACYRAEFSFYGVIDRPHRIDCPVDTTPVSLPTQEPAAPVSIPDGADEVLEQVLAAAPARPSADAVRESLLHSLPGAEADPATGVPDRVTPPEVAVDGTDIGVALFQPDPRACLLGSRVGEEVLVWRPPRVQVQPGELSCDPTTALARSGTAPPH
jgi:hypothetical protein